MFEKSKTNKAIESFSVLGTSCALPLMVLRIAEVARSTVLRHLDERFGLVDSRVCPLESTSLFLWRKFTLSSELLPSDPVSSKTRVA